jgi:hypothetical protein
MLAGTGALMDYWPSAGGSLPVPAAPSVSLPAPAAVVAGGVAHAVPAIAAPPRSRRPTLPKRSASAVDVSPTLPVAAPIAVAPAGSLGVRVSLPALESAIMPAVLDPALVVSGPLAFTASEEAPPYALVEHTSAPVSRALDESSGAGLIGGVFRKTSDSLRKTGVKTGSSIVGVIRGVGGAVRRALPVI